MCRIHRDHVVHNDCILSICGKEHRFHLLARHQTGFRSKVGHPSSNSSIRSHKSWENFTPRNFFSSKVALLHGFILDQFWSKSIIFNRFGSFCVITYSCEIFAAVKVQKHSSKVLVTSLGFDSAQGCILSVLRNRFWVCYISRWHRIHYRSAKNCDDTANFHLLIVDWLFLGHNILIKFKG